MTPADKTRGQDARGQAPAAGSRAGLPAAATSWIEIDTGAIAANVRTLTARLAGRAALLAVVKANAYGHDAALVARAALDAGAAWLGVNALHEGLELREAVGPDVPILVMGHVPHEAADVAMRARLSLTVYDLETVRGIAALARRENLSARLHVKLETGTNRQGVTAADAAALVAAIDGDERLALEGLSTHFADIEDTTDHAFALQQLEAFRRIARTIAGGRTAAPILHAACSAAILLFPGTHFDMARAGISLYGLWPSRETFVSARSERGDLPALTPALSWKARIAQVKDVPAGAWVGYGRTWRAMRASRIAVLPVGYYEGYARSMSGRAHVLVRGRRAPVVGRICMNMMMADVTDVPGAARGDHAVLLGRDGGEAIRAEDLAGWAGTIHYEIVSRIHPSLPRVAVSG